MTDTIEQRALELLVEAQGPLASAIARQIKRTVPKYGQEDFPAIHFNIKALLEGLPALVRGDSMEKITATVRDIARERSRDGFSLADFTIAGLCVLPVLRHFYIREGGDQGLAMYDAVEAVVLPFIGRAIAIFAEVPDSETDPEESILHELLSRMADRDSGGIAPVTVEAVERTKP